MPENEVRPDAALEQFRRENERLRCENERLRRSVEELGLLNEVATALGTAQDVETMLHRIVRSALGAVRAGQGTITLVDAPDGEAARTVVRTSVGSSKRAAFRPSDVLLGWMHWYRKPIRINDPATDERFNATEWDPAVRSILAVPLLVRSTLVGVLAVFNKHGESAARDEGFSAEDERLLAILASQSAQVIENARLAEGERELLRVQEQLRLAADLQARLLPGAPPKVPGYDLAGWSLSSEAVGGDYFDFIPLEDGHLGFAVGDVVGKGLPAALLMANTQATLRGQAPGATSAAACLERANALLHRSTSRREFVTLFYGILDPGLHRIRYANAGHNRPLLIAADHAPVRLETGGLALGLVPGGVYEEAEILLGPGDLLLVYSDGVTEAMGPEREVFGEGQLAAVLEGCRDAPAASVVERVVEAVRRHAGAAPQSDDVTVLAVRRQTRTE